MQRTVMTANGVKLLDRPERIYKQGSMLNSWRVVMQLESDNSCRSEATFDEDLAEEGMLSAEDVFLA